jgi:hypothetical protein
MEQGRLIFKLRTGSHLYGLNHPESDEDFGGVFIPKSEYILGLKRVEEVDNSTKSSTAGHRNTADDVDDKVYALPKYLHLALENNPNIVEFFFATPENILVNSPEWQSLVAGRSHIVSQKIYHTFKGYAFSQKKKLTVKSERFTSLAKGLDWIEESFTPEERNRDDIPISETDATQLNSMLKYYKNLRYNCESFHLGMSIKMIYEHLKTEYDTYGWRVHTKTFETLGYDVKFGYHLIRILSEAVDLLATGELHYPISGQAREDILAVREAKLDLPELLALYEKYEKMADEVYATTKLPKKPDFDWANNWLIDVLRKSIAEELDEEERKPLNFEETKKLLGAVEVNRPVMFSPPLDMFLNKEQLDRKREEREIPPLTEEELKGLLGEEKEALPLTEEELLGEEMKGWDALSVEALFNFEESLEPGIKLSGAAEVIIAHYHKLPD